VIEMPTPKLAVELYEFACSEQFDSLGINLVETEGSFVAAAVGRDESLAFWETMMSAWRRCPQVAVREIFQVIQWDARGRELGPTPSLNPSIDFQGNVVILSPEFQNQPSAAYEDFLVGNVLEQPLAEILINAREAQYFKDFVDGVNDCESTCRYFSFCQGGEASNKYYELGSVRGTETNFCITNRQALVDAYLGG
jgi:uncharacterized protein